MNCFSEHRVLVLHRDFPAFYRSTTATAAICPYYTAQAACRDAALAVVDITFPSIDLDVAAVTAGHLIAAPRRVCGVHIPPLAAILVAAVGAATASLRDACATFYLSDLIASIAELNQVSRYAIDAFGASVSLRFGAFAAIAVLAVAIVWRAVNVCRGGADPDGGGDTDGDNGGTATGSAKAPPRLSGERLAAGTAGHDAQPVPKRRKSGKGQGCHIVGPTSPPLSGGAIGVSKDALTIPLSGARRVTVVAEVETPTGTQQVTQVWTSAE